MIRDLIPDSLICLSVRDMPEGRRVHKVDGALIENDMIDKFRKRIVSATDGHVLGDSGEVGIGWLSIVEIGPHVIIGLIESSIKIPQDDEWMVTIRRSIDLTLKYLNLFTELAAC